nr:hypothetical protein [Tanacetum cinerariifolium]
MRVTTTPTSRYVLLPRLRQMRLAAARQLAPCLTKAPAAGGAAPAGAATLGGTGLVGNIATDMLMWGVAVPATYQPFWQLLAGSQRPVSSNKLPLKGLKLVYLGDSITYQGSYQSACDALLQVAISQSFGFVGQTWATALTNADPGALKERPDAQQAIRAADQVHVHLGTNDPGHGNHVIGQPDDAATAGTLCGDIRAMYEYIRSLNSKAGISFSTPTARGAYGSEPVDPALHPVSKLNISLTCAAIRIMGKVLGVPALTARRVFPLVRPLHGAPTAASRLTQRCIPWAAAGSGAGPGPQPTTR